MSFGDPRHRSPLLKKGLPWLSNPKKPFQAACGRATSASNTEAFSESKNPERIRFLWNSILFRHIHIWRTCPCGFSSKRRALQMHTQGWCGFSTSRVLTSTIDLGRWRRIPSPWGTLHHPRLPRRLVNVCQLQVSRKPMDSILHRQSPVFIRFASRRQYGAKVPRSDIPSPAEVLRFIASWRGHDR